MRWRLISLAASAAAMMAAATTGVPGLAHVYLARRPHPDGGAVASAPAMVMMVPRAGSRRLLRVVVPLGRRRSSLRPGQRVDEPADEDEA